MSHAKNTLIRAPIRTKAREWTMLTGTIMTMETMCKEDEKLATMRQGRMGAFLRLGCVIRADLSYKGNVQ